MSDPGQAPTEREDSVLIYQPADPTEIHHSGSLYIIASGLSSGERGQLASRYVAQKIMSLYFENNEPDLGLRLREALEAANADLYDYAQQRPELVKVGVVIVAVAIRGELAHIAQVGDSRTYLIRDGHIRQLTRDHTLVQQLLDEGAITQEDALSHPRRDVLLRTLGTQETITADIFDTRLRPDDALVLCSNTLPRALSDEEISQIVASKAPRNAAEMLVQKIRGQGIKQGVTVITSLLRDGAPPIAAEIPYMWDRQPASFDNQPTLMMKRVSLPEEKPVASPAPTPPAGIAQQPVQPSQAHQEPRPVQPAPESTSGAQQTQPAPLYQTPIQPAPTYGEQQPVQAPVPIPTSYAAQQPPDPYQQQHAPSGYVVDPVTGLPPVPQSQASWGAPQGGYAPRIYQPPGQPNVQAPRQGLSIGVVALFGLMALFLVAGMVLILVNPLGWSLPVIGEAAQEPTVTPTTSLPEPTVPVATTAPAPIIEPTEQQIPATEPAPAGMVLVEGGAFLRGVPDEEIENAVLSCIQEDQVTGHPKCYREYFSDAQPVEQVTISPFYIDTTEVTNRAYAQCVAADICTVPEKQEFYNDPNHAEHPVTYVTWDQAKKYCEWAGKRLPWEAEWEKAARWDPRSEQSYVYPWGNTFEAGRANTAAAGRNGTSLVTEFAQDISPWGVYDMAGNVSEWIGDWYNHSYQGLGTLNPKGPQTQPLNDPFRVARGGSFQELASRSRSGHRFEVAPNTSTFWLGFRCVLEVSSAPPLVTPTLSTDTDNSEAPTAEGVAPTEEAATPVP
ncbi:MAG: SUMF1/EgtB/PvdO family nonheme iron enzyme [Anaerolineae bacterium]|nr:SUMF1/EgtB/PvdO family nonheme iron enzyme [Anaerolineae bacterium]